MGGDVPGGHPAFVFGLRGMLDHVPQQMTERFPIGVGDPREVDGLQVSDALHGEPDFPAGDQIGVLFMTEIQRRPVAGDDHRQTASHRLGDRQPETLTAVRVYQAVACGVEAGKIVFGEDRFLQILDFRVAGGGSKLQDFRLVGLPPVKGGASHILDDQADIVAGGESFPIGIEQDVDPLPPNRSAHEQEAETLAGFERIRLHPRSVTAGVDPVGNDENAVFRQAGADKAIPDEAGGGPDLVDCFAHRADPFPGKTPILPRLDHHPRHSTGDAECGGPLVSDPNVSPGRRGFGPSLRQPSPFGGLVRKRGYRIRIQQAQEMALLEDSPTELAVDFGEGVNRELGTFPDDMESFFRKMASARRNQTGGFIRLESPLPIESLPPSREKEVQILPGMSKSPFGSPLMVKGYGTGLIVDAIPRHPRPQAEVHVLDTVQKAFIKAAKREEKPPSDHQTGPGDHVQLAPHVCGGGIRRSMTKGVTRHPADHFDAGMLDRFVGIKQFAADHADPRTFDRFQERRDQVGGDLGVVVEKEEVAAPGGRSALVASACEAQVLFVAQDSNLRRQRLQP
ncbi:MAG: hypothetical protein WHT06_06005 [Desulfobacterales bacterium]